jgi:hypothetical protein
MKLFLTEPVLECLRVERAQFRIKDICFVPTTVPNKKGRFWGFADVGDQMRMGVETTRLDSSEFSIWVRTRDCAELDDKILVRGAGGFAPVPVSEAPSQGFLFQSKEP